MAKLNQAMTDLLRYNGAIEPQKRSSFSKSHSHCTTLDSGYLVPITWDRVLPGDEKRIFYNGLARMATPIHPTMDEAYLDVFAFFVPDRLWWSNAKKFYGENLDASFNPDKEYKMPYLKPSQYYVRVDSNDPVSNSFYGLGSLNDYFGMPVFDQSAEGSSDNLFLLDQFEDMEISAGLHRSYQLIWNEWFRNSSIQPALQLNTGDTVSGTEWNVIGKIRKTNKLPDYFMTLLKEPQSGNDVLLTKEWIPVVTRNELVDDTDFETTADSVDNALIFGEALNGDGISRVSGAYGITDALGRFRAAYSTADMSNSLPLTPLNLWGHMSSEVATVNSLRQAITIQQLLEIDNIAGKRYQQILYSHFGVLTPDGTLQRPLLLGQCRQNIGMRQVLQTSATDGSTPQGNVSGVSVTNVDNRLICDQSFTEPGFILVLATIRPLNSYSQGVDCLLRKLHRFDHYWPVFDNLGNQPVYESELNASIDGVYNPGTGWAGSIASRFTDVLGYKSAWTEYRVKMNRVSGLMRPDVPTSLASWNYSNYFSSVPVLNSTFIESDPNLIDRTIAVQTEPQFILDSYFDYIDTKSMSIDSIPGLTRF